MILTYHEVVPQRAAYIYSMDCAGLEEHFAFVSRVGQVGGAPYAPPVVTFDDGHVSHWRYGLPLLERFGLRAIFFVTAGWTGVRAEYMTWRQLADLISKGHEVQAHGWSHRLLTACSDAELENELRRPREVLEDRLGIPIEALSVPGGRVDERVWRACAAAGYKRIYTSDPWSGQTMRHGTAHLGRFMVRSHMSSRNIEQVLAAEGRALHPLRLQHMAKLLARKTLGDRLYLRLWRKLGSSSNRQEVNGGYDDVGTTGSGTKAHADAPSDQ